MKKRRICVAAAVICLLLSGCTSLSLNSPDILTPPKAEGSQAEIQELIKKSAGKSFEMVYPERGDYQSSVIFVNLDDDDDDEAIAMYTREKETVDLLVADKKNNNYTLLTEGTIHAPKIDRVELADFGGKTKEIVISYPGSSATLQSLTFLSVNGEDQDDMINSCAAHVIGDFNGDNTIDSLDLIVARKALIAQFSDDAKPAPNKPASKKMDVNKNGSFEIADIVMLQSFVMGKINTFPEA